VRTQFATGLLGLVILCGYTSTPLNASGPLGVFGIVQRVVFEPDEEHAERIQIWGAFAYHACPDGRVLPGADGRPLGGLPRGAMTDAQRGYLYYMLPPNGSSATVAMVTREWLDIKAIAGTGQPIAFGNALCGYVSRYGQPYWEPDGYGTNLRVRPDAEKPVSPAWYHTNMGIVKLNRGADDALVGALRAALEK
jgi:hypothetical protein